MSTNANIPLPADLPAAEPGLAAKEKENFSDSGQNGTFPDIGPQYRLSNAQCQAIELALNGLRWSEIAENLSLSRKTLWRWKTCNAEFGRALANARAQRHGFAVQRRQTLAGEDFSVLARYLSDADDRLRFRAAQLLLQAAARFKYPKPAAHAATPFPRQGRARMEGMAPPPGGGMRFFGID